MQRQQWQQSSQSVRLLANLIALSVFENLRSAAPKKRFLIFAGGCSSCIATWIRY
ncbi:hypothetical protein MUK70_01595 [Dyadobacter chenwenxiniae]|uniref:Uncharacterized protein n=1 Tax=Dyadobacter chenwenxiniae TaxID=2906456 RepID=A0A9X1TFD5_9BACT|nr:hypothetical protein [Dyadobacter chenwenxiniae]MCF0062560.1 hypothetical protein [Dyadobacter chenwenxiniae]UON83696.1 hypothetical protein MUK70_01595 [Dyadobacter chenwenxiniae]